MSRSLSFKALTRATAPLILTGVRVHYSHCDAFSMTVAHGVPKHFPFECIARDRQFSKAARASREASDVAQGAFRLRNAKPLSQIAPEGRYAAQDHLTTDSTQDLCPTRLSLGGRFRAHSHGKILVQLESMSRSLAVEGSEDQA